MKKEATLLKPAYKTDLFDDPCYINTQTVQSAVCTARGTATAQIHGSPLRQASRFPLQYYIFLSFEKRGVLSSVCMEKDFGFPIRNIEKMGGKKAILVDFFAC